MFSNFVYFKEVTKLSQNITHFLSYLNYSRSILHYIISDCEIQYALSIVPLIEDKKEIISFVECLHMCHPKDDINWLNLIFENIEYVEDIAAFDNTLLIYCCVYNQQDKIKYLIERTDCYNRVDIHVLSDLPLLTATKNDDLELCKYLVSNGANVRVDEDRPFSIAARNGNLELLKYFVEQGSKPAELENFMIDWIIHKGHTHIIDYLNQEGYKINIENNFPYAKSENDVSSIVKYYLNNGLATTNECMLLSAIGNGDIRTIEFLISEGANTRLRNDYLLVAAAKYNQFEVVKLLVEFYNCNIHTRNDLPLIWSANRNNLEMVKYFIEKRAYPLPLRHSALVYSANKSHMEIFKYLRQKTFEN